MQWARVGLVVLAMYAVLWQPAFYMNDEFAQGVGLAALADGHYAVWGDDVPNGYRLLEQKVNTHTGYVPPGEGPNRPVGSDLLNVLALPVHALIVALGGAMGVMAALGLLAGAAIYGGVQAWRPHQKGLAVSLGALAWVMSWPHPAQPIHPFAEIAAIQIVNALFAALAAGLMWDLLAKRASPSVAWVTVLLYVLGTPALFWTLNLKYHGLAMALCAIAIWCYHDGHKTGPLRTGLAFACAGLGLSNHIPSGLVVLASLGLVASPGITLGVRNFAARAGAGLAGLTVGLIPEVTFRARRLMAGLGERYVRYEPDGGTAAIDQVVSEASRQNTGGYLRYTLWNDPARATDAWIQNWFWTDYMTPEVSVALPFLALVPVLVAVPFLLRRTPIFGTVKAWALLHLLVMIVFVGSGILRNGAGFDLRHAATLWPFLALLMAGPVTVALESKKPALVGAQSTAPVALAAMTPLFLLREWRGRYVFQKGDAFELTDPVRVGGLALAFVLAFAAGARHWVGWRATALGAALAWGPFVQLLILLGPGHSHSPEAAAPFVLWPVEVLSRFVAWFAVGTA